MLSTKPCQCLNVLRYFDYVLFIIICRLSSSLLHYQVPAHYKGIRLILVALDRTLSGLSLCTAFSTSSPANERSPVCLCSLVAELMIFNNRITASNDYRYCIV
jgi:hypothetical protein